jgi:alginate O-acetyltransferase complex protein AlgI
MAKKVIMADSLDPVVNDIFFMGPDSFGQAWLGAILFTFQIYFDFSGYSDIAVGAAYLLGFRIPFNFRTPYSSTGPAEFWRRWHITLSTWIRDFVYIPLGGSRGNQLRVITVLIVTTSIAGLWHGANYTFIAWGTAWGIYILVGRILQKLSIRIGPLQWILHMSAVIVLWVIFRAVNLDEAFNYIAVMVDVGSGVGSISTALWIGLGVIGLFGLHWLESHLTTQKMIWKLRKLNTRFNCALLVGLIIGLLLLPSESQIPFIYFRF